ncbi:MAG: hypothetical protein LBS29_05095 [Endomicrobium sp.]|jgi:hypothetical protein|nr:hypothetical protein [Endomicrobium sp.]
MEIKDIYEQLEESLLEYSISDGEEYAKGWLPLNGLYSIERPLDDFVDGSFERFKRRVCPFWEIWLVNYLVEFSGQEVESKVLLEEFNSLIGTPLEEWFDGILKRGSREGINRVLKRNVDFENG